METIQQEKKERVYVKPATKKHEAMNTVQGSGLYSSYSSTYKYSSLYSGLYRVTLYYYY